MTETPISRYRALMQAGDLQPDPAQELAVEKLQILHHRLAGYDPREGSGWLAKLRLQTREPAPEGIYLYGEVGRGKSMVMDLFFDVAPLDRKRRVHFHSFMQEVHGRINDFRKADADSRDGDDPIPVVAKEIAEQAWLLCFDEFEVRDIADAMILGRLFTKLFEAGVVVVATSNREPDALYKDGLNRQLFLPFIAMLKEKLDVLSMQARQDYRLLGLKGIEVYHHPLDAGAKHAIDAAFAQLTAGAHIQAKEIEFKGRKLTVPAQAAGVAQFTFADLCEAPLAAGDYLVLAEQFHTFVVSDIPRLGVDSRNEARRFVMLIDVLYDQGCRLIVSADAPPDELYEQGDGRFEFDRTISRLIEMQTADWVERER
jgi:cell division protein ZapE